eukprot:355093-Chlamydomonas_euryale.AAC.6
MLAALQRHAEAPSGPAEGVEAPSSAIGDALSDGAPSAGDAEAHKGAVGAGASEAEASCASAGDTSGGSEGGQPQHAGGHLSRFANLRDKLRIVR